MPASLTPLEQAIAKALAAALVREIRAESVLEEPRLFERVARGRLENGRAVTGWGVRHGHEEKEAMPRVTRDTHRQRGGHE